MADQTDLVRVDNLAIDFATDHGEVRALRGVSFSLRAGEVLGIVGESGSGKTVACRAILKLLAGNASIASGRILFDGRDVLTMSAAELGHLRGEQAAMIFQNPSTHLDPIMPVGRQVAEAMVTHEGIGWREAERRAVGLLEDMQIRDAPRRANAYPHELSGGMRQRVMIAAALACRPKLLIADEPTTALDVTIQAQILDLLRALQREFHMAVILITHDLGVVAEFVQRVIVMYAGRIVEDGPVATLFAEPKHPYTEGLLASIPDLDRSVERLAAIPGAIPSPRELPAGCRFHPRCGYARTECTQAEPPLIAVGPERGAACIRHVGYRLPGVDLVA
ncbi:MAG: ABC transporter ATP-binding protein [Alphaproteobacteria bacterium]|nr:ABC transporter ATP-binding protein [Alphaproteobacteria bacterium]